MSEARDRALKALRKEYAGAFEAEEQVSAVSTGSLAVDIITGIGGFPRGRLSEVFGWEASGKTTLCLMAAAKAVADGLYPVYVDAERAVDISYARHLGVDLLDEKKASYIAPATFEETAVVVDKLAGSGEVDLIVVDSVPAMVPKSVLEGKIDETGRIGEMARLLASVVPRWAKTIAAHKTALVIVNQMRQQIDTSSYRRGPLPREMREKTAGGSALRFFSSLRIECVLEKKGVQTVTRIDDFTAAEIEVPIANRHSARAFKNKIGAPYRRASFTIRFDQTRNLFGIDNRQTVIDLAVSHEVIQKRSGGHYRFEGPPELKVQGEDALYEAVRGNEAVYTALSEAVVNLPDIRSCLAKV